MRKRRRIPILSTFFTYGKLFYPFIRWHLYILILLTLGISLLESIGITLFLPLFTSGFSTEVARGNRAAEIVQMVFDFFGIQPTIAATVGFILLFFSLKAATRISADYYRLSITAKMAATIRRRMVRLFASVSYPYYVRSDTGRLTNVLTTEIENGIRGFTIFSHLFVLMITILALLGFMLFVYWQFTLLAVFFSILVFVVMRVLIKQTHRYSQKVTAERGIFQSILIQAIQAFKYIRATGRISSLLPRLDDSIDRISHFRFHLDYRGSVIEALKDPLLVFFVLGLMSYQFFIARGEISAIAVFLIFFMRIIQLVLQFQSYWNGFTSQTGSINAMFHTLRELEQHQQETGERKLEHFQREIRLDNVTFAYTDRPVLENISLRIPKNTTVALVGRSGAGKSTLVDLIAGLLTPQKGVITIDGIPLQDIDRFEWQKKIGYVTQDPVIFNDTVANNISLWECDFANPACAERIVRAAKMAYCHDFIQSLPEQYLTEVGDRGIKLSGGQKQRIAIARELFKEPELLILDEATSALDTESERAIQQSIDELRGKLTVIIIAHRLSTVRNADVIYVLDNGRIVEFGDFETLVQQNGLFRQMVEMQTLLLPATSETP